MKLGGQRYGPPVCEVDDVKPSNFSGKTFWNQQERGDWKVVPCVRQQHRIVHGGEGDQPQ